MYNTVSEGELPHFWPWAEFSVVLDLWFSSTSSDSDDAAVCKSECYHLSRLAARQQLNTISYLYSHIYRNTTRQHSRSYSAQSHLPIFYLPIIFHICSSFKMKTDELYLRGCLQTDCKEDMKRLCLFSQVMNISSSSSSLSFHHRRRFIVVVIIDVIIITISGLCHA